MKNKSKTHRNYPDNKPLTSEEIEKLKLQAYWQAPHKLTVASPNPMLYPRSLWRMVEKTTPKNNDDPIL